MNHAQAFVEVLGCPGAVVTDDGVLAVAYADWRGWHRAGAAGISAGRSARGPFRSPRFLALGDQVEVSGLGTLRNSITDE